MIPLLLLVQAATGTPAAPTATAAATQAPTGTAPAYGPSPPAKPVKPAGPAEPDPCLTRSFEPGVVVVCGKRDTYRLDPVLTEARKRVRDQRLRPKGRETFLEARCKTGGAAGCQNPASIDLIGATLATVRIAQGLAAGKTLGSLLKVGNERTEYQIYQDLLAEAEEKETGSAPAKP